jgi:hypothetical protein
MTDSGVHRNDKKKARVDYVLPRQFVDFCRDDKKKTCVDSGFEMRAISGIRRDDKKKDSASSG